MKKWVIKRSWPNTEKLEIWEFIDTEEEARKYWYVDRYLDKYGVENEMPLAMNDFGGFHSLHNIMDSIVKIVESDEKPKLSLEEQYLINAKNFSCGWIAPDGKTYSCDTFGHYDLAQTLCYKYYGGTEYNIGRNTFKDPDGKLMDSGWVKVTYRDYYANYEKMTDAQAEVLLKQGYKTNMYEVFKKIGE